MQIERQSKSGFINSKDNQCNWFTVVDFCLKKKKTEMNKRPCDKISKGSW